MIMRRTTLRRLTGFLAVLCLAALLSPSLSAQAQKPTAPPTPPGRERSDQPGQADPAREIEKLKEEIQQLKDELREQNRLIESHLTFAPESEAEDYAQARSRFRTKLLRKDPAPGPWSPVKPPTGVAEIEFPSGELRLKAWVNRPADQTRKHPAVLFVHGGFHFGMRDWEVTKPYHDAGFVVLAPILRAENGQPGAFSYFYDEVDDVLAAAEYLIDSSDPRESQLRSPMAYASSFKCPVRMYNATETKGRLMSLHTAALAKRRGLDVEAVEIEGNHNTHVPRAMMRSIAFFQSISAQEIAPWNGEPTSLPKTTELELGNGVKMKFVRVEPGKFQMGSPPSEAGRGDDEARHEVEITRPYGIGVYEVTQAQYRQVMGVQPGIFSSKGFGRARVSGLNTDDFPVVGDVRWEDAMDFCRIVSLMTGVRDKGWMVDLPMEAEWEYAARAGTGTAFPYGSSLSSEQENFNGNNPYGGAVKGPFLGRPTTVGSYAPNAWGLYDLLGNVEEWCKDWYDKDYQNRNKEDKRVIRGGAWGFSARDCRAARRRAEYPDQNSIATGFRVVVRLREK